MRKKSEATELAFIIIIAFLISATLYFVLAFLLSMFDLFDSTMRVYLNSVTSTLAGLIIGYKLKELTTGYTVTKRPAKKKSKR